ncbi:MAG: cobyrinate a,c-diamide synthase [Rhodocyclaceae bacterium]|jgi:cobyrinic acid a,c-diamide synthase|nr:cobyrinate a,c-diamide synthase [Rhodocyclaceae bacterium]
MHRFPMHRFLVSAAHKSSGKTTISIGLAAALKARGLTVQPFKKGPDYIDPLWLGLAAGRGCRNLDFFLSSHEEIRDQFNQGHDADVCLVEGNKGLYDGLALDGANSNAALARLLDLPVILVIDARGMTRGIAPLILGYQAFERDIRIAGVILNRLGGGRHEAKLRSVIEHYTDVPVVGAVHEDAHLALVERHLGLMPANEAAGAEQLIAGIAERVARQVDLDRLLAITATTVPLAAPPQTHAPAEPPLRVAIAQDAAFGFYYGDDLDAFARAGAELVPFDALHDAHLPPCDALFIGGGFPESFLDELSANETLRSEIGSAIASGLPTYAECGGLMYLARNITWNGVTRPMVGVIDGEVVMHPKPVGRGYVILESTGAHPWRAQVDTTSNDAHRPAGADFSGLTHAHEFHYSELRGLPAATRYAYSVRRGHGIDGSHDGIVLHNLLASYTHLRAVQGCNWPAQFVQFARACHADGSVRLSQEIVPCSI